MHVNIMKVHGCYVEELVIHKISQLIGHLDKWIINNRKKQNYQHIL